MSVPREASDGAIPRTAAPEPPSGASPEEMEVREDLTIEAKEVREAIRFGHADAKERFREFDERCETAGWGRSIADRLFRALHREDLPQGPSTFLMSLTATVRAFREPTNWRGPARRALERLGSVPESASILPVLEAERDARVRTEEAEKAVAEEKRRQAEIARIARGWKRIDDLVRELVNAGVSRERAEQIRGPIEEWKRCQVVKTDATSLFENERGSIEGLLSERDDVRFLANANAAQERGQFDFRQSMPALRDHANKANQWRQGPKIGTHASNNLAYPSFRKQAENSPACRLGAVAKDSIGNDFWFFIKGGFFACLACGLLVAGYYLDDFQHIAAVTVKWICWALGGLSLLAIDLSTGNFASLWAIAFLAWFVCGGPVFICVKVLRRRRTRIDLEEERLKTIWLVRKVLDECNQCECKLKSLSSGLGTPVTAPFEDVSRDARREERSALDWEPGNGTGTAVGDLGRKFRSPWESRLQIVGAFRAWAARGARIEKREKEDSAALRELLRDHLDSRQRAVDDAEARLGKAAQIVSESLSRIVTETAGAEQPIKDSAVLEQLRDELDVARENWNRAKTATDAAVADMEAEEQNRAKIRIKFARLKERMIQPVRAKVNAVREVAIAWQGLRERFDALEADLASWEKSPVPSEDGFAAEKSTADSLLERAARLEDDGQKAAKLASIVEKARKLEETAYVSEDAPLFAKEEMETTRRVLEIVARQTDFTKAEKAAMVLRAAKRRKQRIENAVRVYAGLADRLEKISQLEQRAEEARRKLLWRDTSIGPVPSGQAVSIRSSRSLDGFTKELERRKEQLAAALTSFESARQSQFAAFREMAAEALCTGKTERHRLARLLDLHEDDQFDVAFDEESASWYIRGIGWAEDRTLQLDPQPSILFDRTRAGTFEARCLFVLAWYKLLLDMRRKRQEDALRDEGIGDVPSGHVSPFPAPAFLRLRELAGSRPVDDPEVRKLVATNRAWDELCNRILKTMPVKNGEADAGHRRMFRQANDAVQRLAEMCDMSPVGSRDVQTELGRLQEASAWVKRSRKLREQALEARSGVIRDVEELGLFGRRIEPDPYLEKGDCLFSQSDFQGATAAFETARRDLNFFFEEWDFQIESCSDSHFAVSLANADDLLEFVKSEVVVNGSENRKNVLWYGRYAITGKQYRAFFPKAESADFYKSGSCTAVTIDEAKEYAEKITILARRANFRLPDGSSAVFRLPHFKEWKAGIECNAFQTNSLLYEWCETYSRDYAWWFSMNGQQGRNPRYNRYSNIGFRLVCNRIG